MNNSDRQKTGYLGEKLAADYLMKNEYVILEKNYHSRFGEIDILAKKESKIYVVEVKTRKNISKFDHPEFSITYHKLRRIRLTFHDFLYKEAEKHQISPHRAFKHFQIDVIIILLNSFDEICDIRHYKNVEN